jgi:tRNA(Ile)-lysidine synthase
MVPVDGGATLAHRVERRLRGSAPGGGPILVALSGGRDSLVLLHLLRFGREGAPLLAGPELRAVHVDHRMRSESGADASWVTGLCGAWRVPLDVETLPRAPGTEGAARTARYRALRRVARDRGAATLLLAHHADDQAETVLFRLLRGTGPRGLAGIPPARLLGAGPASPLLLRPLLDEPGAALERWAAAHGLRAREDPSNQVPGPARNRIRLELLPALEARDPEIRPTLVALARAARAREATLEALVDRALDTLEVASGPGTFSVARTPLLLYPDPFLSELLRAVARRGGRGLTRRGAEQAVGFVRRAGSGRRLQAGRELRIERDFDRLVFRYGPPGETARGTGPGVGAGPGEVLVVEGPEGQGRRSFRLSPEGAAFRAWWQEGTVPPGAGEGRAPDPGEAREVVFPAAGLRFPLRLRGRRPGDRVRVSLEADAVPARRRLKKLLMERRVSRGVRDELPLLVDAEGLVIWIPGVWRSRFRAPREGERTWTVGVDRCT